MRGVGAVSSTHPQSVSHPKEKGLSHGLTIKQLAAEIGINVTRTAKYASFAFTERMSSERHISSIVPPVGYRPKPAIASCSPSMNT